MPRSRGPDDEELRRPTGRWRYWWPVLAVAIMAFAYAALAGLEWWLQANAHAIGARAVEEFGGDEVTALVALVDAESQSLRRQDEAVYALGQIADPRALPALRRHQTGRQCDHEHDLCQYELAKAVERCSGLRRPPRWLPLFPHRQVAEER